MPGRARRESNLPILALTGTNLFLAADSVTTSQLAGRIIPQGGNNLNVIGQLFTDYLKAENISLVAKGDSVFPTGSSTPVNWLSAAFQTLDLNVILPGKSYQVRCTLKGVLTNRLLMHLKIIESITLADFGIVMTDQSEAYAPLASSYHTTAVYKNPFGFSLQVVQSAVDMTVGLANNGTDVATVRT